MLALGQVLVAMLRLRTSSVIAIEKTPSLKATIRENSTSFSSRRFAVCSPGHRRDHRHRPRRNGRQWRVGR